MANFDKDGRNVHGLLLKAQLGTTFEIGLWGPIDTFAVPPRELDVVLSTPSSAVTLQKAGMNGNVRIWRITGLPEGKSDLLAKTGTGEVWSSVTIELAAAPVKSQAGKAVFTGMDACGIAALDEILTRSISEGVEFAGLIFRLGHLFGFTSPVRGEPDASLPGAAAQAGTTIVGTYHTHGNKHGAGEIFSPQDRGFHNLRHWFGYLGTPTRVILRFTPKERDPNEHPGLAVFGGKAEKIR